MLHLHYQIKTIKEMKQEVIKLVKVLNRKKSVISLNVDYFPTTDNYELSYNIKSKDGELWYDKKLSYNDLLIKLIDLL